MPWPLTPIGSSLEHKLKNKWSRRLYRLCVNCDRHRHKAVIRPNREAVQQSAIQDYRAVRGDRSISPRTGNPYTAVPTQHAAVAQQSSFSRTTRQTQGAPTNDVVTDMVTMALSSATHFLDTNLSRWCDVRSYDNATCSSKTQRSAHGAYCECSGSDHAGSTP
eukprot:3073422-Amphidinium_carterae.3